KTEKSNVLKKLCYENFDEFYKEVTDNKKDYNYISIFANFNANEFYSFLINSNPKRRWEILNMIIYRYDNLLHLELKPDIPFLQKLKKRIEKKSNRTSGKNIDGYIYSEINK